MRSKIAVIFGTRPEAIKLAPVILALKDDNRFACDVCVTAQHRQMLDQVLQLFDITPDVDLKLMEHNQTLATLTAKAVTAIDLYLKESRPELVLVQGDTTTVLCATLAAFYNRIPVGHVEAGLRTGDLYAPWPEEANRILTSRLAALHFSPTEWSATNLIREGVGDGSIYVTGNTVIDALQQVVEKNTRDFSSIPGLTNRLNARIQQRKLVLITGHRRENFGTGFESICKAIRRVADRLPEIEFVYPVHLNPKVQEPVQRILGASDNATANVHLIEPLPYRSFVALLDKSTLVLTDSGGIQEEAPGLGKPVLVMREKTERPEGVRAGTARLVGTDENRIVDEVVRLLTDRTAYESMARAHNPYGDGQATPRILDACARFLNL